ncbi:hypothetical protein FRB94_010811 [Tulasnella sp. JGI-2019a]|nr:hypothetical protein FRB94_010811 [Tulasnella sp. JGI-2019a]
MLSPSRKEYGMASACCVVVTLFYIFFSAQSGFDTPVLHLTTSPSSPQTIEAISDQYTETKDILPTDARVNIENSRVVWNAHNVPVTKIVQHQPGWTILDNVYALNGTFYLVHSDTTNGTTFPERYLMISNGAPRLDDQPAADRAPTDVNMQIINATEAKRIFGTFANRMEGTSFVCYDDVKYFAHYYHYAAEILLGLWRTYSSLDTKITAAGHTSLPQPRRFITPNILTSTWRDYAKMNQYVFHAALPSTGLEFKEDWTDRAEMYRPFVFDRIVLQDSTASRRDPEFYPVEKITGIADRLPKSVIKDPSGRLRGNWWSPVRWNVVTFSGLTRDPELVLQNKPVITYVSRQSWGRRMLRSQDHDTLVRSLEQLREKHGWEVNVVELEGMSRMEQIKLVGRSTILMGVHGNGLTALLWMQSTHKSAVFEFFYPQGFAEDYEYTSRLLGIKHYGWWNNTHFTYPDIPDKRKLENNGFPPNFQSNEIPLDGEAVAKLCEQRLLGTEDE